jgi:hypothetical protein
MLYLKDINLELMNTKFSLALFSAALVLVSCKKELMPQDSSPVDSTAVAAATQATQTPAATPVPATAQMLPNPQTNVNPAPPQPVAVGKGMNPAHGQPGHRCDIPVGAPLNSPAKTGISPQKIIPGQPINVNPTAGTATPAVVTAPGMNPPHGQQGHRCDIAVGAPLSTPVKAPAAVPATVPATITAPAPTTTETKQ